MTTLEARHLIAGAEDRSAFFIDDRDRIDLLEGAVAALGETLIAYCLMNTHLHFLCLGSSELLVPSLEAALARARRTYRRRHGLDAPRLRGPVEALRVTSERELARALEYVHRNPEKANLAKAQAHWAWSSARAFAGLSRVSYPDVPRVVALLGHHASWALPAKYPLADLEPSQTPCAEPGLILLAAAQTHGVDPDDVIGVGRDATLTGARGTFVKLGHLERFTNAQLGAALVRTPQRIGQIAAEPVDVQGVRIARTLLRDRELRARLVPRTAIPALGPR
jgi:hypothetical protein